MTTLILICTHIVCVIGGVIAGALIWRNNAKKFSRLEQVDIAALVKEKTGIDIS